MVVLGWCSGRMATGRLSNSFSFSVGLDAEGAAASVAEVVRAVGGSGFRQASVDSRNCKLNRLDSLLAAAGKGFPLLGPSVSHQRGLIENV